MLLLQSSRTISKLLIVYLIVLQVGCYGKRNWSGWQFSKTENQQPLQPPSSQVPPFERQAFDFTRRAPPSVQPLEPPDLSFSPPRYQFPGTVSQPQPSSSAPTVPPSTFPQRPAPPLQGRPASRHNSNPNSFSNPFSRFVTGRGGWSSHHQRNQQLQLSLNDTLNPYRHSVSLDPQGRYNLTWVYDFNRNLTIFNVTARTIGWVGLGLSRRTTSKIAGADLIIGGVYPNGTSYFSDRYAIGNQLPLLDRSQDWTLHESWERDGQTFLSISRALDTCDPDHDIPITDDSLRLLWAFGETDELNSHYENRGRYDAHLLTPDLTPLEVLHKQVGQDSSSSLKVFNMTSSLIMPVQPTTYWCTWFRAPTTTKHHIIGFASDFPTDEDAQHVHHLATHKCIAPPGIDPDTLFGPASRTSGSECYFYEETHINPVQYCRELTHAWGVGGRPFFFPDHVGFPMSETGVEYHMLQVHFDNPDLIENLNISFTFQAFYTDELREHDVSMLGLAEQTPSAISIVIPPMTNAHATIGICPSSCTERVAGMLHTHTTGSGVRIMHFRENRELPWILHDDNWNFNFQQFRVLHEERRLLPGDILTQRCEYDTTGRNGSAVVGGFGTYEAMCSGNLYYYPRQAGFSLCRSLQREDEYWDLLKVRNATWDTVNRQVVVSDPPQFAGVSVFEHVNRNIEWNGSLRRELQMRQLFGPQVSLCPNTTLVPEMSEFELVDNFARRSFPRLPPQPNSQHPSRNPTNIPRYRKPAQCDAYASGRNIR